MIEVLSDNELVKAVATGCVDSFEEIINRYSDKAYSLATRFTKNKQDAEEVLQDVFTTVYRKIDSFEGKSSFSSWLYRVTVNASLMKIRKRNQDKSILLEEAVADPANSLILKTDSRNNADEITARKELLRIMEEAITSLPDEYRPVFILRDIDGLSSKEVSKILKLSVPAVKSRLHRSRLLLRRKLAETYKEFGFTKSPEKSVGNL
ncbi:MAG: sigma-70 family RNA polymerase sigma factor [Bdellovibrionales bacterium]|nr:sigma-70 family RNA polymerase sigma factor [Bdellovibrionales bacterium]